jgi:tetraacyldisaccharide 4'-kinase
MRIEDVWFGKSIPAALGRVALLPLAGIYALGMAGYRAVYKLGIKRAKKPHPKIVCVGNLAAGGSGKTPLTVHIAQVLTGLGYEVAIGCSGYGSPRAEASTLAPTGPLQATEWGDEPAEIRDALPETPLIVGRRRVLAAEICAEKYPNAVLLMDDGFQHLPLAKDVTIVVDHRVGNTFPFPAGPYRETRLLANPTLYVPNDQFKLVYSGLHFSEPLEPGAKVNLLCAIANPHRFRDSVEQAGFVIGTTKFLADHDPLNNPNLFAEGGTWLVTAKDWVKLRVRTDLTDVKIIVATRTASIEPRDEFAKWLKIKLG